jgi:hypothetical protein
MNVGHSIERIALLAILRDVSDPARVGQVDIARGIRRYHVLSHHRTDAHPRRINGVAPRYRRAAKCACGRITAAGDLEFSDPASPNFWNGRLLQDQLIAREGEAATNVFILRMELIFRTQRTDAR